MVTYFSAFLASKFCCVIHHLLHYNYTVLLTTEFIKSLLNPNIAFPLRNQGPYLFTCHEPKKNLLSVSPSKEMGDRTRQRKKSPTSAGIEFTPSGFDRPLLYQLSYEDRRQQVVSDYGGNCEKCECEGCK